MLWHWIKGRWSWLVIVVGLLAHAVGGAYEFHVWRRAPVDAGLNRICNATHCVTLTSRNDESWECLYDDRLNGPLTCRRLLNSYAAIWRQWVFDRAAPSSYRRPAGVPAGWSRAQADQTL